MTKSKQKYGNTITTAIGDQHQSVFESLLVKLSTPHSPVTSASLARRYIIEGIERDWK